MKMTFLYVAIAAAALGGCATAEKEAAAPAPAPAAAAPAAAPKAAPVPEADDLAAIRDPKSPLYQRSVFFDYDSFTIKDQYKSLLQAHGSFVGAKPKVKIVVQGNADERGSREYNLALGQKRAEAVKRSLAMLGVKESQMEAVSFGKERPRDPGHNEESWAKNRRADIAYPGEY